MDAKRKIVVFLSIIWNVMKGGLFPVRRLLSCGCKWVAAMLIWSTTKVLPFLLPSNGSAPGARTEEEEWAPELPTEILERIAVDFWGVDVIRMGSVCKSWREFAANRFKVGSNHALPWLLVDGADGSKRLYNYVEKRLSSFEIFLPLKYAASVCYGSAFGWLIFVEKGEDRLVLTYPFREGVRICLPPFPECYESDTDYKYDSDEFVYGEGFKMKKSMCAELQRVVISVDPSLGRFQVVATFRHVVAFLKYTGGVKDSWIFSEKMGSIQDYAFAFYRGSFLVASNREGLLLARPDDESGCIRFEEIAPDVSNIVSEDSVYLVENSSGEYLHMVIDDQRLYRVVEGLNGGFERVAAESLSGDCLFMGNEFPQPISVSAALHPWCKPNHVYVACYSGTQGIEYNLCHDDWEFVPFEASLRPSNRATWVTS